jgi:magnesium-transporting ATPase (P-type)
VTFCVGFFTLDDTDTDWLEAISISLVCAVAMIPEGLEALLL